MKDRGRARHGFRAKNCQAAQPVGTPAALYSRLENGYHDRLFSRFKSDYYA